MSSIQDKTIRPGSLRGWSYYYSSRQPSPGRTVNAQKAVQPDSQAKPAKGHSHKSFLIVAALVVIAGFWLGFRGGQGQPAQADQTNTPAATSAASTANHCDGNSLDHFIKVGVDQRHLWACQGGKQVYDTAVITGLRNSQDTETPVGTYKIYAKETNTTLSGSDSRGSWKDPVYYWMPFLDNQFGTYGFHDATWRPNSAFGQVSPDSQDASHGCVELPLAASKWLYNWAPVGTTVTVES